MSTEHDAEPNTRKPNLQELRKLITNSNVHCCGRWCVGCQFDFVNVPAERRQEAREWQEKELRKMFT